MSSLRITTAQPEDEPSLWILLYYAAHMAKDGLTSLDAAKDSPYLRNYAADWGQKAGDFGVLGYQEDQLVGGVWSRLLIGDNKTHGYIDDHTPELATAVLPDYIGQGIGTQLLQAYLAQVKELFPAVTLNVRADNPAFRLYQRVGFQVVGEIINRVGTKSYTMIIRFTDHRDEIESVSD